MRNNQIPRKILEHHRSRRVDHVPFEESFIGCCLGLWHEIGGSDIENILEHRLDAESLGGTKGMFPRPICENKLAAGEGGDGRCKGKIGKQRGAVDVMREIEKLLSANLMFLHQAAQRRAIAFVVVFLQGAGRHPVKSKKMRQEQGDSLVDFRPQIAVGRIKRVVEIEDPGIDLR